jgi:hypothetical protein
MDNFQKKEHEDAQGDWILVYSGASLWRIQLGSPVNCGLQVHHVKTALSVQCMLSHSVSSWSLSLSCDLSLSSKELSKSSSCVISSSSVVLFLLADVPKNATSKTQNVCIWLSVALGTTWSSSLNTVLLKWTPPPFCTLNGSSSYGKINYLWITILQTARESVLVKRMCFMSYRLVSTALLLQQRHSLPSSVLHNK